MLRPHVRGVLMVGKWSDVTGGRAEGYDPAILLAISFCSVCAVLNRRQARYN
jgi:hypothetical protein